MQEELLTINYSSDLEDIFLPILEQVSALMEQQLELAKIKKINVTVCAKPPLADNQQTLTLHRK